jgi:methyl-accepting chemotaxis protein
MEGMSQSVMTLTPEQLTLLGEYSDLWRQVHAGAQSVFDTPNPADDQKALKQVAALEASAQSMAAFAQGIHLAEMQSVRLSRESANAIIRNTSLFLIGLVVIAVVVGTILARLIGLGISRPIAQLTQTATNVSLGELDRKIEVKSKGEIGELAAAIERMRTSLKMTIDRLAEEDEDLRSWTTRLVDKEMRRKVRGGVITLGGQRYEVGKELDGQFVYVKFDPDRKEIVVTPTVGDPRHVPLRG